MIRRGTLPKNYSNLRKDLFASKEGVEADLERLCKIPSSGTVIPSIKNQDTDF